MKLRLAISVSYLIARVLADTSMAQSPLTTARQILEISPEKAALRGPARITGVVTCSDASSRLCFLQDATAGIYLDRVSRYPEVGDVIEVTGRAAAGLFSPIMIADHIDHLGKTNLPSATPVSLDALFTGRHDANWVEIEGVVQDQIAEPEHLVLSVATGNCCVYVRILRPGQVADSRFVDARVKIRGVAATIFNHRRQITGFQVLCQTTNFVEIIDAGPVDPFDAPLRKSTTLVSYSVNGIPDHRSRLIGAVTFFWPNRDFYVADDQGSVRVQSRQTNAVAIGDLIELVGFRDNEDSGPTPRLIQSVYRVVGHTNLPAPAVIPVSEAFNPNLDGEIISLEGKVLQRNEGQTGFALSVETAGKVFRVRLQERWKIPTGDLIGAQVRVTGLRIGNPADYGSRDGFTIWVRTPKDLEILKPAPIDWAKQSKYAAVGIGGAIALAGAWVFLLRVRVRRRTEEIQKREAALEERFRNLYENANDVIYTHDLEGRITSVNNAGQALFGYTQAEFSGMHMSDLLGPEELAKARARIQQKMNGTARTTFELWVQARNGEMVYLDVNSRLIFADGVPVGVQGIGRNITERRLAEEALRVSERQLRTSLEERERLGRDLHDGIIQSIYAAGLYLEDSAHLVRKDPVRAENGLRKLTGDLNLIIREVRSFILGLERHQLKGEEFTAALKTLALTAGEHKASRVELFIDEEVATQLTSAEATQLLQIAREALSNSIRHGHAERLTFELRKSPHGVTFELSDDGVGFEMASNGEKGYGLRNMAARAEEINASFKISSRPNQGSRIVLDIRRSNPEISRP